MWRLGGEPDRQLLFPVPVLSHHAARFHGVRDHPLIYQALPNEQLGSLESGIGFISQRHPVADIVADEIVQYGGVFL